MMEAIELSGRAYGILAKSAKLLSSNFKLILRLDNRWAKRY
jgi:hypothetical protein